MLNLKKKKQIKFMAFYFINGLNQVWSNTHVETVFCLYIEIRGHDHSSIPDISDGKESVALLDRVDIRKARYLKILYNGVVAIRLL